jgi:hypothetical protein
VNQESTTEVNQPAQPVTNDGVIAFVFFGMLFVGAGFLATILAGWLWPSLEF